MRQKNVLIPYPFIVFTFGLAIKFIQEFEGVSTFVKFGNFNTGVKKSFLSSPQMFFIFSSFHLKDKYF
jgi:hypothetical protein